MGRQSGGPEGDEIMTTINFYGPNEDDAAFSAGAEFALQSGGALPMDRNDDIPVEDFLMLRREYGNVTVEMERSYRDGYNSQL